MKSATDNELDSLLDAIDEACNASMSERNARAIGDIYAMLASVGKAPADATPEKVLDAVIAVIAQAGDPNRWSGVETGLDLTAHDTWSQILRGQTSPPFAPTPTYSPRFINTTNTGGLANFTISSTL